jgi:pimeloyl-ACP methyl ester carboxylesterase
MLQWSHGCRDAASGLADEVDEQDDASAADDGGGQLDPFAAAVSAAIDALGQFASDLMPGLGAASAASASLGSAGMAALPGLGGGETVDDPDDDIDPIESEDLRRSEDGGLEEVRAEDGSPIGRLKEGQFVVPRSMRDIALNLQAVDAAQTDDATTIRVQEVTDAQGNSQYIVYVPGSYGDAGNLTNPHDTGGNPMDWNQNPGALLGDETDSSQAVERAMEAAGVPKGSDVIIAGHSQGGIVAAGLAQDPDFNGGDDGYNVTNVVTYGSPVENKHMPDGTESINFANRGSGGVGTGDPYRPGDPIPHLDEPFKHPDSPLATSDSHREVGLEAPNKLDDDAFVNHGIEKYVESMKNPPPSSSEAIRDFEKDGPMDSALSGGSSSDTVDVPVSRDPSTY